MKNRFSAIWMGNDDIETVNQVGRMVSYDGTSNVEAGRPKWWFSIRYRDLDRAINDELADCIRMDTFREYRVEEPHQSRAIKDPWVT